MRIASLLPSATEIVCAVGARDDLVGVSHECDFPAGVEQLTVLTRPRVEFPRASGDIDRAVRDVLESALAVYEVEVERLEACRPDVVVTQDLCDVCAVSLNDVESALAQIGASESDSPVLVNLKPTKLADVWADVRRVAVALGRAAQGEAAARELERRVAEIGRRSAELDARPAIVTIEWLAPVMVGGTWMPELVELAGGAALVTVAGQHAPTLTRDELAALDPDVVLIKPCGFELERTLEELELLRGELPWDTWRAAREGRVFIADGNAYFNRPGPRLVESLEILAACAHPEEFGEFAARHARDVRRVAHDLSLSPFA